VNDALVILLKLLAVLVLVLLNGFFVAAEFALVSVRRTRIDEQVERGVAGAQAVQRALKNLDRVLAAAQLGITMASLALGWLGEPTLAVVLKRLFGSAPGGAALSVIIAFTLITALHIVIGEQAPKLAALQHPERTAVLVAQPLSIFDFLLRPFILVLSAASRATMRLLGLKPSGGHELVHSAEELKMLVEASGKAGALDEIERALVGRAFLLGEFQAHEVMLPRTEVTGIPNTATARDLLALAHALGYSRFPVYDGSLDNVVGIVHVKDALSAALSGGLDTLQIAAVMRPPLFFPETTPADTMLDEMRGQAVHMAFVVDEFGGLAGLVTFERILERLIGAVRDEFERPEQPEIAPQPDGSYLIDGLVNIGEINDRLSLHLDDRDYDTIGGLTFGLLGHIPEIGEVAQAGDVALEVVELDGRRVARVRLHHAHADTDAA